MPIIIRNLNDRKIIIANGFSLLTVIGLNYCFKYTDSTIFGNSIYSVLMYISCYLLFMYTVKKPVSNRVNYVALFVGIICSLSMLIGRNILLFDDARLFSYKTMGKCLMVLPFWFFISRALFSLRIPLRTNDSLFISKVKNIISSKYGILIMWVVILIFWSPYFLAYYPGIYGYDGPYQVSEFLTHNITTHHPVMHTFLLGMTVGKGQYGLLIYSIIQMTFLSFAFAYLLVYLAKWSQSKTVFTISIIAFLVLPFYPIMALTTTKNVIFTGFFVILQVQIIRITKEKNYFKTLSNILIFIVSSFFSMAFLRQFLYVFVVSIFIMTFLLKENRRSLLLLSIISVLTFLIYSGPISSMAHVINSSNDTVKESLSIPECQLSRVAERHSNIAKSDLRSIKNYLPDYQKYKYPFETISDPVKDTFNASLFKKSPVDFIELYLKMGREYPNEYVNAFCKITAPLWYPDMNNQTNPYEPYWETHSLAVPPHETKKAHRQMLPAFRKYIDKFTNQRTYEKIPIVSLFFSAGVPFFIMLIGFAQSIVKKDRQEALIFVIPIVFWLVLLFFSPVILLRYVLPLISIEGLMLAIIANNMFVEMDSNLSK